MIFYLELVGKLWYYFREWLNNNLMAKLIFRTYIAEWCCKYIILEKEKPVTFDWLP